VSVIFAVLQSSARIAILVTELSTTISHMTLLKPGSAMRINVRSAEASTEEEEEEDEDGCLLGCSAVYSGRSP
jgi:hypothetical protein